MGQEVSSKGLTGLASVRIGGMTLDTLPMAESARTQEQWAAKVADQERQEVENILAESPPQTIKYLRSRVAECTENIQRIRDLKARQQTMIDEYTGQISLCVYRDKELDRLENATDPDLICLSMDEIGDKQRDLKLQFPPYNVAAMKQQIKQCQEAIARSDDVIDKEHESITELQAVIAKCLIRDTRLAPYGVKVG